MAESPLLPPMPCLPDGRPRRVGIEVEFTGLDSEEVAVLVRQLFGGTIVPHDPYRYHVRGSSLGDFTIELDMRVAHPEGQVGQTLGERAKQAMHVVLGAVGSLILPFEVVFPPLEIERLGEADRLIEALRERGAKGTKTNILHAFGLHLNPEAASFEADYLARHLKAFALLAPWLRADIQVDIARQLSPFTRPYPPAYVRLLADPAYQPDRSRLIDDYLAANPTRDRELDMLPLFAMLAPEKLQRGMPESKVKPRPTFHYRLPDSNIDLPGWGVVMDWNRWVIVERLAADPSRLATLGRAYLDRFGGEETAAWVDELRRWAVA